MWEGERKGGRWGGEGGKEGVSCYDSNVNGLIAVW